METSQLLLKDQEKMLQRLSGAREPEQCIRVMEDELGRILCTYNEECRDDLVARTAGSTIQTAKASLALIDSLGEISIYERTMPQSASKERVDREWMVRILAGGLMILMAVLLASSGRLSSAVFMPVSLVLAGAGGFWLFRTGKDTAKGAEPQTEHIIQKKYDPEKLYHHLTNILMVIDQELEDAAKAQHTDGLASGIELQTDALPLAEDEMKMLAGVLQAAYLQREQPYSRDIISDIRFYLHRKGIEVADYNEQTERYFDQLPSGKSGTIRPALLQEGILLCKGLAAVEND